MTNPHRPALRSACLALTLAAVSIPTAAGAQRQQMPGPDTKKVLVTTFRGDVAGGIRAADEIRNRIKDEFNIRTLYPNPKKDIDASLLAAGYPVDSALSPNDIKELARQLRADEVLDGVVSKTASGYRVEVRMFLPRDVQLSQPLGTFESKDFGDVAKQVVDEYDKARKQIPDNQACENGIRANTPATAIDAARKGIQTYSKSTLVRLCLASAYVSMKQTVDSTKPWKDSVISVTREVIKLDPVSRLAYELLYEAYRSKADTANALKTLIDLSNADPSSASLRERVIFELLASGKADLAYPFVQKALAENPDDPTTAKTNWQTLRLMKRYKESVPAGVAWVKLDTASADSAYFFRQITDLANDSAFAKAADFAAEASAKYPKSTEFLLLKAQNERKSGQLPAAKATLERVLQLDPKVPLAAAQLATIANDLGQTDEAVRVLKADAAADTSNKARDAALVLGFGKKLYDAAAVSKSPADYLKAVPILRASDEIAPSENASFFLGLSAFQALASNPETLKTMKTCDDFKGANELLILVSIHMPRGAKVSKETAGQILGYVPQVQAFVDASMKKLCK